tara:strand:+ start:130 stop:342 length:213 start_codon:yes stop_codon:yes gene_type:complete
VYNRVLENNSGQITTVVRAKERKRKEDYLFRVRVTKMRRESGEGEGQGGEGASKDTRRVKESLKSHKVSF